MSRIGPRQWRLERAVRAALGVWPVLVVVSSCSEKHPPPAPSAPICRAGERTCEGDRLVECRPDGRARTTTDCFAQGGVCSATRGCIPCATGERHCSGEQPVSCDAGHRWVQEAPCDRSSGLVCSLGMCADLCAERRAEGSYIGCEYYAIETANPQLSSDFAFAVALGSTTPVEAHVTIESATFSESAVVSPGGVEVVRLPWVPELKGSGPFVSDSSVLARGAAFLVVSDVPITVHQFNPLEFHHAGECTNPDEDQILGDGQCFSFTNDASLLLPVHALTGRYMVLTRPSLHLVVPVSAIADDTVREPDFVTIAAVADGDTTVELELSGYAAPTADGSFAGGAPGEIVSATLSRGDVLQVVGGGPKECDRPREAMGDERMFLHSYCDTTAERDLTGTILRASQPVAVIAGHACDFIPFDYFACDHLEEQLPPAETWSTTHVVPRLHSLAEEPNVVRVLSDTDGNRITFEPPDVHEDVTLARGVPLEFEAHTSFVVTGGAPLLVAQFLVGQRYGSAELGGFAPAGDPAMGYAPPSQQLRSHYQILVPATYEQSWLSLTAPTGRNVSLDGVPIAADRAPVGGSGWEVFETRVVPGEHTLEATEPFGVYVYGFAAYTSYLYVGGLDLEPVVEAPF